MSLFRFLFIAFAALAAAAAAAEADPCLKEDYAEANCAPRRRTTPILRAARAHCRATIHNHAARPRHRAQPTEPARHRPAADGQCCAQGGYKKEGHGDICKIVGPKVKGKKEL